MHSGVLVGINTYEEMSISQFNIINTSCHKSLDAPSLSPNATFGALRNFPFPLSNPRICNLNIWFIHSNVFVEKKAVTRSMAALHAPGPMGIFNKHSNPMLKQNADMLAMYIWVWVWVWVWV